MTNRLIRAKSPIRRLNPSNKSNILRTNIKHKFIKSVMDGFPSLPVEIARQILIEAVKARGIKRAFRLRFVSKSWDREAIDAIFQSGILDCEERLFISAFWPNYLTFTILRRRRPLSRALRIIRQVAEHVLAFRGESNSIDALGQCISQLCRLASECNRGGTNYAMCVKVPEQTEASIDPIEDSDDDFLEALLAAAAGTNENALAKQLLLRMHDRLYLITQDGMHEHE